MARSPGITDAERRARLGRVYRFLLSLAGKTTADDAKVDGPASSAAARSALQESETQAGG
jgi:hypothetical protein